MIAQRYAVVSCHVEAPIDDRVWAAFSAFQRRTIGGFRIAPLMRPPDLAAGEPEDVWLERAREAAKHGPLGHHTHFGGPKQARPAEPGPEHAERVRAEAAWLRERGLKPRFFCGGGWYMDEPIAAALAELGYVDCTATSFRPAYLAEGALRIGMKDPTWLRVGSGRLLELPTTHSLGRAAHHVLDPQPMGTVVHLYFHDTDLLDRRRRLALQATLIALGCRRRATDLDHVADEATGIAGEGPFAAFVR